MKKKMKPGYCIMHPQFASHQRSPHFPFRVILFMLAVAFSGNHLAAQSRSIDSLVKIVQSGKEDTAQVNSLNKLSGLLWKSGKYDDARKYAEQALALAQKKNYTKGAGAAYNNIGVTCDYRSDYGEALKYYLAALEAEKSVRDSSGMAVTYNDMAVIFWDLGNYPDALKDDLASLKIDEALHDSAGIAKSEINSGLVYLYQNNFNEALNRFASALSIGKKINDRNIIAYALDYTGVVCNQKGDYDRALEYYSQMLVLKKQLREMQGVSYAYNNIALVYEHKGDYPKALENFSQSLRLVDSLNDKYGAAACYINFGKIYLHMKNYAAARENLDHAIALLQKIGHKEKLREYYEAMARLDSATGNFSRAFSEYKMYVAYRDSLYNESSTRKTTQLQMQYEFSKKNEADSLKNTAAKKILNEQLNTRQAQLDKEKTQRYALYGGIGLLLVFGGFIFNRFTITQKQKKIIEHQKLQVEVKNKDITDSINYAQRIQSAILPSASEIENEFAEAFVLFRPKDIVSGDFFWTAKTKDFVFVVAADCTGHGVPGGFMSMLGSSLLNEVVIEKGITEPGEILDLLRVKIILALKQKGETGENRDGMDMVLCRFNTDRSELVYAAANNPVWIVRHDGKFEEGRADKQPVGIHTGEQQMFSQHRLPLHRGDCIYIFTDGYADQFGGPKGKKFKYKQLGEILTSISGLKTAEQKNILDKTISDWKGQLEQVDDILIIGMKV